MKANTHGGRATETSHRAASIGLVPLVDFGIQESIKNAIIDFLSSVLEALVSNLLGLFSGLIEEFLFFPRPGTVSGLETIQEQAIVVFAGLLLIGWLAFFLDLQIFPYNTKSDPYRLLERSFAGIVMVIAGPTMLNYAVVLTSAIGKYFYPSDVGERVADIVVANPGGSIIALALLYAIGTTLIIIVAGFFVILSVRMFLVYVLFALLPLFAAFWVFDTGVGKYTKKTADMFFKATAMILVAGILIAAVLNVGLAVADVDPGAVSGDDAAGEECLNGMDIAGHCVLDWGQLFAFIGIGGAMTVSTTVAMLGVGTLMGGGGMGNVAAGAVGGIAAGAIGNAKSAIGGGGGGGDPGAGGEPGPGEGGGTPGTTQQFTAVADGEGGGNVEAAGAGAGAAAGAGGAGGRSGTGSTAPSANLDRATTGGAAPTPPPGGGGSGRASGGGASGQGQKQQDKSLLDKTAAAADTGSKIGGVVGKVDPAMGAAVTAAAGAYKFHQEGGFSDVKHATADAGNTIREKVADLTDAYSGSDFAAGDHNESDGQDRVGTQTNNDQMDW